MLGDCVQSECQQELLEIAVIAANDVRQRSL
jgi:hypothetical protein